MSVHVVDASALGALVFGEPQADAVAARLDRGPLAAPVLIRFELANICLKKIKAHPALEKKLLEAYDLGNRIAIQLTDVDHREVIQMARKSGLSAYDASYLWLALKLKAELITLDIKLKAAAARLGIVAPEN
ncbi:MAG: type II toxin-antitoxin system VapC family toxin [Syntrophaceae bacterium]